MPLYNPPASGGAASGLDTLTVDDASVENVGTATDPSLRVKLLGISNGMLGGAIALSKLVTDPLARAGHTGTQAAATISDFDNQVRTIRLDQLSPPTAAVEVNGQQITGLGTPTAGTDAGTKDYIDAVAAGLSPKDAVRVASTANVVLATALENGDTLDGVVLATGDRVLLKNQTLPATNGLYVVAASGAPARATDADSEADLLGASVYVVQGTAGAGTGWVMNSPAPITLETTALNWSQYSGPGVVTVAAPLTQNGNQIGITSPLPVANGGTGGATAADARTALGALPATHTADADPHTGYVLESLVDAKGDLLVGSANNTVARVAAGTDAQILVADSTQTAGVRWADGDAGAGIAVSIINAKGDLIVGTAADTVDRKAVGSDGQFLQADAASAGGVKWATVAPGAGASISGVPVAGDLVRWQSSSAIGSSSAASPSKGPLVLRGPVRYNPLYHTNLLPLKTKTATWVDLLAYIHAARDAIVADGWPGILELGGGFWPVSAAVVLNNPLVSLEGVGSARHSDDAGEAAGAMNTGTTLLAMDNFAGEEVLRIRRNARATMTGVAMDHHKARGFAIDGNMGGTGNTAATYDGILYDGYESILEEFSVALCPGHGLQILPPTSWEIYETFIQNFNIRYCGRSGLYLGAGATDMHIGHFTVFHNGISTTDGNADGADIVNYGDGIQIVGGTANQWHDFQSYSNRRRGVTVVGARQKFIGNMKIENNRRGGLHVSSSDGFQWLGGAFANNSAQTAETYDDVEITSGAANVQIADCWFHPNVYGDGSRSRYGINITSNPVGINIRDCDFGTYRGSAADQAAGTLTAKDARIKVGGSATGVRIRNCHPYNPYGKISSVPAVPATLVPATATPAVQNLKQVVCRITITPNAGCTITQVWHGTTSGLPNMQALGVTAGLPLYMVDVAPGAWIGVEYSGGTISWWWQGL